MPFPIFCFLGKTMAIDLSDIDKKLLAALQEDARLSNAELGSLVNMSPSPAWRRVKRLEEEGVITGYHASVDRRKLGYGVLAFVTITIDRQDASTAAALEEGIAAIPEVVTCHGVSGQVDFVLIVVAPDLDSYSQIVFEKVRRLPGVREVRSSFSIKAIKERAGYPVGFVPIAS